MTPTEFCHWVVHHNLRFPGFSKWADDNGLLEGDAPRMKVTEFGSATLEDAVAASDWLAMNADAPDRYGAQLRVAIQRAKVIAQQRTSQVEDTGRVRCSLCKGDGMVGIRYLVPPKWLTAMVGADFRKHRFHAACDCDAGRARATRSAGKMDVLDRGRMEIA